MDEKFGLLANVYPGIRHNTIMQPPLEQRVSHLPFGWVLRGDVEKDINIMRHMMRVLPEDLI